CSRDFSSWKGRAFW
nr:immunoglobulin heavy chain junction region [Macaca mulatta]MOV88591.1 immunoglobulin heavy chain junction region [Macaca mulatta]MOV92133.1 immunoglobulin heavy chain junction region [Macaca mulatta]